MACKQDARPFIDLQKDAEEFVAKFEQDIAEWKNVLDSKITSLISDPDSSGNRGSYEKNPLIEFSKAKYAIFISMKSLANDTEKEWIKYINEMKKLFLENVEIFLAGTKLEVKLPSSVSQPISGTEQFPNRKGPGYSNLMPSSLYPIISNFTKNMPALSSPLQRKESHSPKPEETVTYLNASIDEGKSKETTSVSLHENVNDKVTHSPSENLQEISSQESKLQGCGNKSKIAAQNKKAKAKGIKKGSGSESQEESSELESGMQVSNSESQDDDEIESEKKSTKMIKRHGRRGRKPAVEENKGKDAISQESEETSEVDKRPFQISSRKSVREASKSSKAAISKMSGQSSSEEDKKLQETEMNTNLPPMKGRKGRQALKSKEKENGTNKTFIKMNDHILSKENEKLLEIEVYNINMSAVRGRRGKQSKNEKKENAVATMSEQSSSEENEKLKETEINLNIPAVRGRRGRPARKEKENVFESENQVDKAENDKEQSAPSVIPATHKGRSAATKSFVKPSDQTLATNTRRGRGTTKEEGQATKVSRRPTGRKTLNERISESDSSISPVRVILPVEEDINDDLDVYTPVARSTKSSARRKTLLPNLDAPTSVVEATVKGNTSRAKSKRKTISGVSDLASVAPSKRLKISSSQTSNTVVEDEAADGDNLLDSYSDWIVLKNIDGKIPSCPAIYEVKVWRAKKSAYIGSCESLRQMLTLHKLKQNSGHKHLDKFIERNYNDIQVRYEVVASLNDAKAEVKNRINNFVVLHKTTPAYN